VIKLIINKVFSITLALLVLVSTMSFTIDKHFCGNTLIDIAVFTKAKGCGMELAQSQNLTIKKSSCCKDEIDVITGQDQLKINTIDDVKFQKLIVISSIIYSYIDLFETLPNQIVPHKNYSPPDLIVDIQVVDQVFII
jgi:hypothetical protein